MIGIDTAHLKFQMQLPSELLTKPWLMVASQRKDGSLKIKYWREKYINDARINMVYRPEDYQGRSLLVAEISSLPKLVYGSNIIYLPNIEVGIQAINRVFDEIFPGIGLDAGQGVLERIDFCHDYDVGDYVDDYIEAISRLSYRNWRRDIFLNRSKDSRQVRNNGVSFRSADYEMVFYNKQLESGVFGLLRQESRLKDTDVISAFTGLLVPTLCSITPIMKFNALQRDLERLGLWGTSITGGNLALVELMKHFPARKAHRLFYILSVIRDHPMMDQKEIASYLGIGTWMLNQSLSEIKDAGITPGLIDRDMMLPPLYLPSPRAEVNEISPKVASDTAIDDSLVTTDEISLTNQVIK